MKIMQISHIKPLNDFIVSGSKGTHQQLSGNSKPMKVSMQELLKIIEAYYEDGKYLGKKELVELQNKIKTFLLTEEANKFWEELQGFYLDNRYLSNKEFIELKKEYIK